jgi:maltose alpha-D-glucosyltransferase/alpha-amylase
VFENQGRHVSAASEPWYRNAIIYAVDIEKFADSNGDGIGDIPGLIQHLDYIDDLGVTCLWLLPFYPSPRKDNGYDCTDYYAVDPRFGTFEDFDRLVRLCGERGIRIIIDIVMDHTSDEHPWFQAARRDAASRFRSYYTWVSMPPRVGLAHGSAFPGEESSLWKYDSVAGAFYYHPFYRFQPQLNMSNSEVCDELLRVLDFWMCFGVSGFRLDAVPLMLGLEGPSVNVPLDPLGILRSARGLVSGRHTDSLLMGEVDLEAGKLLGYFGDGDQLNALLGFLLNNYLFLALATESPAAILRALRLLPSVPDGCQWVNFLRNNDELNIQWLPEQDRAFVWDYFAPDQNMRIYDRGIRRRLAPMIGDPLKTEMAFSLMFSLPGSALFMYGDEIGMGDDLSLPGRDSVRTPMQWSAETNAGFSSAPESRLVRPLISEGPFAYTNVNVDSQLRSSDSLLSAVRALVRARLDCPEIGSGSWQPFETAPQSVLSHQYVYQDRTVMMLHNLGGESQDVDIDMRDHPGRKLELLVGSPSLIDETSEVHCTRLAPYGYAWYRVVPKPATESEHA